MSSLAAIFLAFAVVAAQVLHGGMWNPVLVLVPYGLLLAAGVMGLIAVWRGRLPMAPGAFAALAMAVAFFGWRAWHAGDPHLGRIEGGQVLAFGMALAVAGFALGNAQARWVLLGILGAAAVGQAIIGVVQLARGSGEAPFGWFAENVRVFYEGRFTTRARGTFINPNQLAWFMTWSALFAVALACWARVSVLMRIVLVYLALVFVALVVVSGSRGGMLALLVGFLVILGASIVAVFAVMRRGRTWVLGSALALVMLGAGLAYGIYATNWVAQGRVDSLQLQDIRQFLLEDGLRMAQVAPLLGAGPGTFLYGARLYRSGFQPIDAVFAHNDWLQTLVEYGLVGFGLALLALLVLAGGGAQRFLAAVRRRVEVEERPRSDLAAVFLGALAATLAFAVHGLLDFNMHVPANAMLAGLTLGLLGASVPVDAEDARHRLRQVVMKTSGAVALAALVWALGLYAQRHGEADYFAWKVGNALAREDVQSAREWSDEAQRRGLADPALRALRAQVLFDYDAAVAFGRNVPATERSERARVARLREAAAIYDELRAVQPRERAHWIGSARAAQELRDMRSADRFALTAITLDPVQEYPFAVWADLLADRGSTREAMRVFAVASNLPYASYSWRRERELREELTGEEAP